MSHTFPRRRDLLTGLAAVLGAAKPAAAAISTEFFDVTRYVFVPHTTTQDVTVLDTGTNRAVDTLRAGRIARQALVSRGAATLIASDGEAAAVSLLDLFSGTSRDVALPAPAERLTVSSNGQLVAATNLRSGTVAIVDIGAAAVTAVVRHPQPLRDVMFGEQDAVLYIAAEGLSGIGVIDLGTRKLARLIDAARPADAGIAALARTPDGRMLLARPEGNGPVSVIDPALGKPVASLPDDLDAAGMFPSGTGRYLLVPDREEARLAVFRAGDFTRPAVLPGAAGVTGAYATWLDSVAFLPSAGRRSVLVYDLDRMALSGELALAGLPAPGAVTADSRTLYLPVQDPPRLLAIDGETRSIVAQLDLPDRPSQALVAGGWGLCH